MSDRVSQKLPGLAAVLLFAVMAAIVLGAEFGRSIGYEGDVNITAGIGYLLFDMTGQTNLGTEGFLAAFEIVDVVLVAAIVAAVMLARRDDTDGDTVAADGGTDRGGDQ